MATQVQIRRGTEAQSAAFVGAEGEVTYTSDLKRLVAHDGALAGGFPAAHLHLAQTFPQTQTFLNDENFFGNTTDPDNAIVFQNPVGVGTNTLDFRTNTTLDANFLRKYNTTPFNIELASSGNLDFVIDSRNVATGTSARFWTNGIRGSGTQVLLFTVQDNGGLVATGALNMGTNLINNVVNPVAAQDAATKSYVDGLIAAGAPPFTDSTALVKGSVDPTKLLRFEVDGFTAATTRVITPPDADITLAGINIAQTFALDQTFGNNIIVTSTITGDLLNVGTQAVIGGEVSIDATGVVVGQASLAFPTTFSTSGSALLADGAFTIATNGNTVANSLRLTGSLALPYRAITAADTFSATDYTIDATSGTFTLNLPTAVGITGRLYVAKNSGAGIVTLDADGGELIDGVTTQTINPLASLTVQSTGAGWIII